MVISKCAGLAGISLRLLVPKADPNFIVRRFVALSSADKSVLRLSDVEQNPLYSMSGFGCAPRMRNSLHIWRRCQSYRLIQQYGSLKKRKQDTSVGWIIRDGFGPFGTGGNSARQYESLVVTKTKYLPIEAFTPIAISTDGLAEWPSPLRRKALKELLMVPAYFVPEVWQPLQ